METLLHCWWECKLVQPLWKTVWRHLKKLKTELPYDPAIPLLSTYINKTVVQKDTWTPMFITAPFTVTELLWKHKMSSNRWMDKDVHIHNGILLSHKMNEITPFVTTWLYLNHTKSKTERQISYDITWMWNLNYDTNELQNRNKLTDTENRLVVAWGGGGQRTGGEGRTSRWKL